MYEKKTKVVERGNIAHKVAWRSGELFLCKDLSLEILAKTFEFRVSSITLRDQSRHQRKVRGTLTNERSSILLYIYSHPIPKGFLFSKIGRDDESKTQTRPSSIPLTDAARESRSHEKPTCTWQGTHFHEDVIVQMGRSDAGVSSGGHVGSQLNKCPLETRATPRANLPPSLSLSPFAQPQKGNRRSARVEQHAKFESRLVCCWCVRFTFDLPSVFRRSVYVYVLLAYMCCTRANRCHDLSTHAYNRESAVGIFD